ncbi:conserved hypothetical protein [Kribbella flavida DSM 17836]|uniref:Uncharacterized protein n=1 Tax=Kribbella flavida (strain DSM 17836 / JCM 10339 / NBRC 14399) TaxID=479435 RepID=D2PUU6_KRIFD|nr:hypothetical protein [Kribbella flavida]ADB31412.1 conserved hypothetical protein [Kribbella flavida DSM 17836]
MAIAGRWRIVELDQFDDDALHLVEPAYIEFADDRTGEFVVVAVQGSLDCRATEIQGRPGVEFSWDGYDELDPTSGRGWAVLLDDLTLEGVIYIHRGDEASFRAVPLIPEEIPDTAH